MTRFKNFSFALLAGLALPLSASLPLAAQEAAGVAAEEEIGCIKGDCVDGKGTLVLDSPQGRVVYRGEFRNGLYHGFGRLSNEDKGSVYKGYWDDGKRSGRGTYWDSKNNVYIGQWKDDKRNGQGTQAFNVENWKEDAHTEWWLERHTENYTGEFRNDLFSGEGTYRWPDGTRYVGEWAANQKHGRGYFDYGNGLISRRIYEFDERIFGF